MEKAKPTIVLTIICIIACFLLIAAFNLTSGAGDAGITPEMAAGLDEIFGANGFEMSQENLPEGITSVLTDGTGNIAYEITADGYAKGGIRLIVGLSSDKTVRGIYILNLSETPGVGTKVDDESFLSQFDGLDLTAADSGSGEAVSEEKAVFGTREEINALSDSVPAASGFELDAITGATYSSKGVYNAVIAALKAAE